MKRKNPPLGWIFSCTCTDKPNSVVLRQIVIYLGLLLPTTSSGTLVLRLARPCTYVRILPLHLYVSIELIPKDTRSFQTKASLFAPLGLLQTGVTRYDSPEKQDVFGLSSLYKSKEQQSGTSIIVLHCFQHKIQYLVH